MEGDSVEEINNFIFSICEGSWLFFHLQCLDFRVGTSFNIVSKTISKKKALSEWKEKYKFN